MVEIGERNEGIKILTNGENLMILPLMTFPVHDRFLIQTLLRYAAAVFTEKIEPMSIQTPALDCWTERKDSGAPTLGQGL